MTNQKKLVMAWRSYLDINGNPEIDDSLRKAIIKAENIISDKVPSVKGMILQGNHINQPPEEYDAALKILQAQTLDSMGPPPEPEERPLATKFLPSSEDTKIETGDPDSTQKNGVFEQTLPKEIIPKPEHKKRLNLDDRMMGLLDLIDKS